MHVVFPHWFGVLDFFKYLESNKVAETYTHRNGKRTSDFPQMCGSQTIWRAILPLEKFPNYIFCPGAQWRT